MKWKKSEYDDAEDVEEYIAKVGNFQFIACNHCYDISYYNGKTINELDSGHVKTIKTAKKKCEDWLKNVKKSLIAERGK